jgi:hypothetical protein
MSILIEKNSTATESWTVAETLVKGVSTVVIQTTGHTWTGTITIQSRVAGSKLQPFTDIPYQNLVTLADVAAGTTITGNGKWAVRADLQDLLISHTWSAGSVDVTIRSGQG